MNKCRLSLLLAVWSAVFLCENRQQHNDTYDIVIYGGTSGGIAAAIQGKRLGKSVILIEPGSRVGGLTTGGLGQTDIGNKQVIGGIAREFYQNIRKHYENQTIGIGRRNLNIRMRDKPAQIQMKMLCGPLSLRLR